MQTSERPSEPPRHPRGTSHPPIEDPGNGTAGKGRAELVALGHDRGRSEPLPHEVPGLLPAHGHYAAVDGRAQVRGDAAGKKSRLSQEPLAAPSSTARRSTGAPRGPTGYC